MTPSSVEYTEIAVTSTNFCSPCNPIRDSRGDARRARKVSPKVSPRVSERVLARLLAILFALAKRLAGSLGSYYMQNSLQDSFRDSFFYAGMVTMYSARTLLCTLIIRHWQLTNTISIALHLRTLRNTIWVCAILQRCGDVEVHVVDCCLDTRCAILKGRDDFGVFESTGGLNGCPLAQVEPTYHVQVHKPPFLLTLLHSLMEAVLLDSCLLTGIGNELDRPQAAPIRWCKELRVCSVLCAEWWGDVHFGFWKAHEIYMISRALAWYIRICIRE